MLFLFLSFFVIFIHPIKVDGMIWFENKLIVHFVIVAIIKE